MSPDLLQSGHRVRSARRYHDADGFDSHTSFGGGPSQGSFGGDAADAPAMAVADEGRADAWHTPDSGATTWNVSAPGAWNSTPPEWHSTQVQPDPAHDQWNSGQYPA